MSCSFVSPVLDLEDVRAAILRPLDKKWTSRIVSSHYQLSFTESAILFFFKILVKIPVDLEAGLPCKIDNACKKRENGKIDEVRKARAGLQFHALHIDSDKLTPPCLCLRSVINRPLFSIQKKVITLSFFWAWNVYLSNQLSASFQQEST